MNVKKLTLVTKLKHTIVKMKVISNENLENNNTINKCN